jgi:hypothetical protein
MVPCPCLARRLGRTWPNTFSDEWQGIKVVDASGRQFLPILASESRGSSGGTRPFGLGQSQTVLPHEIWTVYEVPEGTHLRRVIIGRSFAIPGSGSFQN